MFILGRNVDGVVKFCEHDGEGEDYWAAIDFGTFDEAKKRATKEYNLIYEVEVKYEVKSIHQVLNKYISAAKVVGEYLDGGSEKIEYIETGAKNYCFIDNSLGTKTPGVMYEVMEPRFSNKLDDEKSRVIKLLLEK